MLFARWLRLNCTAGSKSVVPKTATLADVQRARTDSLRLKEHRSFLRGFFSGRRTLVVGSAPGAVRPDLSRIDATVCINGSGWTAKEMGIEIPDLTVFSSRNTRPDHRVRTATMTILNGLKTRHLMLIDVNEEFDVARKVIVDAGLQYSSFSWVDPVERAAIVGEVCGVELGVGSARERISNGIFAVTLPVWAGASEIVLTGFSLEGGHAYVEGRTGRGHLSADTKFFELASKFRCPVTTTSPALQERFGLQAST